MVSGDGIGCACRRQRCRRVMAATESYAPLSLHPAGLGVTLQAVTSAVINAEADRSKRVIEGAANADALQREQHAKAEMYRRLTEHMSWGSNDFLKYIKMKALNGQAAQNNVVVGVSPMGTIK